MALLKVWVWVAVEGVVVAEPGKTWKMCMVCAYRGGAR